MAKSLRSKWRRKMRAEKRKKLEPKVVQRLQKTITNEHIPTLPEIAAKERTKSISEGAGMEVTSKENGSRIKPWMNQRRVKRMSAALRTKQGNKRLVSAAPKDQPRIKVSMKKRHKGKQKKLNKRLKHLSSFPVS